MQIGQIIEGVTGSVRNAAAGIRERSSDFFSSGEGEHHRVRRLAVIGTAAAVFTVSGATAALAISNSGEQEPVAEVAVAAPAETTKAPIATKAPPTLEAPVAAEPVPEETAEEAPVEEPAAPEPEKEPTGPVDIEVGDLDDEQEANAVTIIETGKELGFDERGWAVALATAMQEAKLYNAASEAVPESFDYTDSQVTYSDHDSVGIFQQRPSMGWGSVEELMDVATSASKFYGTLADIDGWQDMSIAQAAQSVQISAFPDYYAQWEGLAYDIIDAYNSAG